MQLHSVRARPALHCLELVAASLTLETIRLYYCEEEKASTPAAIEDPNWHLPEVHQAELLQQQQSGVVICPCRSENICY